MIGWLGSCHPEMSALKLYILSLSYKVGKGFCYKMQMYRGSATTEIVNGVC